MYICIHTSNFQFLVLGMVTSYYEKKKMKHFPMQSRYGQCDDENQDRYDEDDFPVPSLPPLNHERPLKYLWQRYFPLD